MLGEGKVEHLFAAPVKRVTVVGATMRSTRPAQSSGGARRDSVVARYLLADVSVTASVTMGVARTSGGRATRK